MMRLRMLIILLILGVAFNTQACLGFRTIRGSGHVVSEERQVSDFTGVDLAGTGNLYIETGGEEALRIEAEDNLLPYLETKVRNGILTIGYRPNIIIRSRQPVNFYLTVRELDSIAISGSGEVQAPDLAAKRFSIDISGSGDLDMGDLQANKLTVEVSGSGEVKLGQVYVNELAVDIGGSGAVSLAGGQTQTQVISLSGSGDYNAKGLDSIEAEVIVSGSSEVNIQVEDRLKVDLSGSGEVNYRGHPQVGMTMNGSGHLAQIDD